jgi:hypothetical protein
MMDMITGLRKIKKAYQKFGVDFTGIRKLECTYNAKENTYHPHFHFLISGKVPAMLLVNAWLQEFPEARRSAQHYTKGTKKTIKEIFKYFTKLVTKTYDEKGNTVNKRVDISAMDIIFTAIRGLRVYQPMGIVKNQDSFVRFVNTIRNTYSPRKQPVTMVLQNEEDKKITAVYTASLQYNDKANDYKDIYDKHPAVLQTNLFEKTEGTDFFIPDSKKSLCYEIFFTGINLPDPYKNARFRSFYKFELIEEFDRFYTELNGVEVNDEIEELYTQKIIGLPPDNCSWKWEYTDWVQLETGELLSNYNPSEAMKGIVETITPAPVSELPSIIRSEALTPNFGFSLKFPPRKHKGRLFFAKTVEFRSKRNYFTISIVGDNK